LFEELERVGLDFTLEVAIDFHSAGVDARLDVRTVHDAEDTRGPQVPLEAASQGDIVSLEFALEEGIPVEKGLSIVIHQSAPYWVVETYLRVSVRLDVQLISLRALPARKNDTLRLKRCQFVRPGMR